MSSRSDRSPGVRVWDALVRVGHWTLVIGIAAAWLTRHGGGAWHEWLGYLVLAVVAIRIIWGFTGSRHARFAQFVHPAAATLSYARQVIAGREPRHLGHNPLGGWMIVALLLTTTAVCASGWLYTTDLFWGVEWVEELHEGLTNFLLMLAFVHICGVIFSSVRQRENLVAAMFTGCKRAPGKDDII
jgi:cytochrome b